MNGAARSYDLSTPAPMPREAARRLAAQRVTLGEKMRVHLRRVLRLPTEVDVGAPETARVRHFASHAGGNAWWYAGGSQAEPAGRSVLLACPPSLIYAGIDRELGGPGTVQAPAKPPTAIEFGLGMRFLRQVFAGLADALALAPLELPIAPHEPLAEPLLTYLPDLEEPFARIPWKVKLLDAEHELLLCLSRKLLESAEPKREEKLAGEQRLSGPVATAPIELCFELGRCRLRVEEAARLAKGDVVLFDAPPGRPIEVKVQGKTRVLGRLGSHQGHYAIEVTEVLDGAAGAAAKASGAANGAAAAAAAAAHGARSAAS